ncbi:hypothetical protein [Corallococcus silvisoli]|uniref:hypothetical protein n=1 Tax=Corallococcus silvisoli TaxID=2697031 RepID=UPI001378FC86|nr:hypothetical protein [Corallococcus silvisoli]NBD08187.1 hypothetical protein [Corallococcus silvisoli]
MVPRLIPVVALLLLASCAKPAWRVRAIPRDAIQLPRLEPSVELELPPRGSVVSASLGDGTPLWLVHREDGTVSVFSALIPTAHAVAYAGTIAWIPTMRRFSGTYVWDDHGRVVGNHGWDMCIGPCPEDKDMPDEARDMDSFQVERIQAAPERIRVGRPVPGSWREIPQKPRPSWSAEPSWVRLHRLSVAEALAMPEGMIVAVDAALVLASAGTPRICQRPSGFSCCPRGSPRLYDVEGIPMRHVGPMVYTHSVPLLRRYRDGFVQYEPGKKLGAPDSVGTLGDTVPRASETWDPAKPPPVDPCEQASTGAP